MENAADAIKLAFGVFVFAIAMTLTFSVVGQARATSEAIFYLQNKNNHYQYTTEISYNAKEERIVGLETILPTIHRYAKEQFAVTIFEEDGKTPIVRYDLYIEDMMGNWNEILKKRNLGDTTAIHKYNEVKQRLDQVGLDIEFLPQLYRGTGDGNITITSPWMGNPNVDTLERIFCDMEGTNYVKNNTTYYAKNLSKYKGRTFKEKFIELSTNGETIIDGNDQIETIKGNKKLEIFYILQP